MPNTEVQVTVNWKPGQVLIRRGTPIDQYGNIANDAGAYGIVKSDAERPEKATVITAGTWDEETGYGGYALTDDCKRALAAISFTGSDGERRPVRTLPTPQEANAGEQAAVNAEGNAYETKAPEELPEATTETAGIVKMAAAVSDSEETNYPTVAEFNGLLAALRAAGIMAEPEPEQEPEDAE